MAVKTSTYPYGRYPFPEFNPVQELTLKYVDLHTNVVVASPTSSGKTIAGELIAGKALYEDQRVVYLSPLKALAEEKIDDWGQSDHPWSDYSQICMTGDYVMTAEREDELLDAYIIIATYEMMDVRCRRVSKESSDWIDEVGVLIVDEAHFLGQQRGDVLENALIHFTDRNHHARIVFLSATLKNDQEVAAWISKLNSKETSIIESDYRPCKLNVHFKAHEAGHHWDYAQNEQLKIEGTIDLIREYPDDQWLLFVHSKNTGKDLHKQLKKEMPDKTVGYHNADRPKESRKKIESAFRKGEIRYLVATSTLAYGVNLPARRVAIVGIQRGMSYVEVTDVIQECGRAGRPKYDTEGDAYVVLTDKQLARFRVQYQAGASVLSQITGNLPFHLVAEVTERRVQSPETAISWGKRTLAYHQDAWSELVIKEVFDRMRGRGILKGMQKDWDSEEDEKIFIASSLGKIATYNYFDPFLVADWASNLREVADRKLFQDPAAISWAVASSAAREGFLPKPFKKYTAEYLGACRALNLKFPNDASVALGIVLYDLLNRNKWRDEAFHGLKSNFIFDASRVFKTLDTIDKWIMRAAYPRSYWDRMFYKTVYGVSWKASLFCTVPEIGRVHATRLVNHGVRSISDVLKNQDLVEEILPAKARKNLLQYVRNHAKRKKVREV